MIQTKLRVNELPRNFAVTRFYKLASDWVRSNYFLSKTSNFPNHRQLNNFPYKPRGENKFGQFRSPQTTLSLLG